METFSYKAIDSEGKSKNGSLDAESKQEAAKKLKDNGLIPTSIETQKAWDKDVNFSIFSKKKKVTSRDLSVFCRQFASILRAGASVISALEMLAEQTENKGMNEAIKNVQSNVEKGITLSEAMRHEKGIFPDLLINMIEAGEASGSLEISIDRMAMQFEKDAKLKAIVKKAMMYPIVLLCVAAGVMILMLTYVIPQFNDMFDEIGSELPIYTKIIIGISDFIKTKWIILILAIAAIVISYKFYKKTESGRHNLDSLKLKIPIFGILNRKTACARFTRTLGILLQAGMPMMEALEISAKTIDNVIYKDAINKAKNGVALGFKLSSQLKVSGIFPAMVIHMTSIGEETGNLEEMLGNVANYYDEEVEITSQQITSLMEPLIIVVMALIVGVLVLSIYGPMQVLYSDL